MMEGWPAWATSGAFLASAALVWVAGTRVAGYADEIARATGIGQAVLGMLLLGGVTSLPELAVASTASIAGHPALSVNDVLGSAAINVLIIAIADALIGRDAITSVLGSPRVLLQGTLGIFLLAIAAAATVGPPLPLAGASAWTWALFAAYIAFAWVISRSKSGEAWQAKPPVKEAKPADRDAQALRPLVVKTTLAAVAVLVGGFFLTKSGEALAQQTGLGTSFFGAVALGAATSLPEVSTVVAAVRLGRYEMAVSDIFGTNLFNVLILFVADQLYAGPPVLSEAGRFSGVAALVAILLTALFLAGMIERRDRTVLRMGWDSFAAIGTYVAGLFVLYQLK